MNFSLVQAAPEISEPLSRGYLLIEPATLAHAPDLAALNRRPCVPSALVHREELMPQLVDLTVLDDNARLRAAASWMAERHAEHPPVICAWLDSEAAADMVAEHIACALVGCGVDDQPVFWRYYDPRVLALTLAVFDPAQRQALLGPIRAWQFAWAGHHWSVASVDVKPALADRPPGWPREAQWSRINRSAAADRVLRRLPSLSLGQAARLPAVLDRTFSELAGSGETLDVDALVALALPEVRRELALDADNRGTNR